MIQDHVCACCLIEEQQLFDRLWCRNIRSCHFLILLLSHWPYNTSDFKVWQLLSLVASLHAHAEFWRLWEWKLVLFKKKKKQSCQLRCTAVIDPLGNKRTRPKVPPHQPHFLCLHPVTRLKQNMGTWVCEANKSHNYSQLSCFHITMHTILALEEKCTIKFWYDRK